MKKILTIGDVHGRDRWMFHTHGSPYEFNFWKETVENGAPADSDFWSEYPYMEFDQIIFVGDYVDSFNLTNLAILNNLKNIIFFKKALPNKVVLLLGNHDVQYLVQNQICSGFRAEMHHDLNRIFKDKDLDFKVAHLEKDQDGNKYLWTHAGVTRGWLDEVRGDIFNERYRLFGIIKDYENAEIDVLLNKLLEIGNTNLFHVDYHSGGMALWAGPLWVRPTVLNSNGLEGINQIVGHTPQSKIKIENLGNMTHYFTDCLFDDCDEILKLDL